MTTLLVANVGGHLTQLHSLAPRLPIGRRVWVTTDAAQSRSLLEGEEVHWLDYPQSRDLKTVLSNGVKGLRQLPFRGVESVVSTGANLAVSVFPLYRARGVPCHYIESATRVDAPSTSGRLLSKLPGVRLYTQHEKWADSRWTFHGTVLDGFEVVPTAPKPIRRVVVTLGSSEGYPFRRPLERLCEVLPSDVEVLWQTGPVTESLGLPIDARPSVPNRELQEAIAAADVVIAHAGTGSTITALANGKLPLLLPRLVEHGEHVDGHQIEIATMLASRGLALVRDAGSVTWGDVQQAAAHTVERSARKPFPLKP